MVLRDKNAQKFVTNLFGRKFLDLRNYSSNSSISTTVLDFTIQCSGGSRPSDKGGGGHPDPEIRRRGPTAVKSKTRDFSLFHVFSLQNTVHRTRP